MRTGDWFQTYSGKQFFLLDPHPDDVTLGDIAHSLANICRFGGHTREFYSVAQHCIHCVQWAIARGIKDPLTLLHILLHDSPEAYLGDVVRPLKRSVAQYMEREAAMTKTIYAALKLPEPTEFEHEIIKRADNSLLMAERRDLIRHCDIPWSIDAEPWEQRIVPWHPMSAEKSFHRYYESIRDQISNSPHEICSGRL